MARDDDAVMTEADEEAMRAKLREAGWDKNKILSKSKAAATTPTAKETATTDAAAKAPNGNGKEADEHAKSDRKKSSSARDKDRDREREGRSGRGSERRRSRSARRRDKDRGDRERRRDRGSRRRRSRSVSKSRSWSRSASVRGSSRCEKDRGGRGRSRADKRHSRSASASRSRSRSLSKSRGSSKRSRRGDFKPESSPKKDASKTDKAEDKPAAGVEKPNGENGAKKPEVDAPESSAATESGNKKVVEVEKDGKKGSGDRKSRKSSRHRSRSASRSASRSRRRRRRHRSTSRSRSASRGRRGRGSSRSRSRSHSRRHRSSRRRSSRSRSRSRSRSYSRRHRSKSRDRSRRDANSSPQPHQFPPAEVAPPVAANPLNPSITQLMQQYPTMSLQDIITKMQASNVTMAAAVSMKPARELYVGNLPASVTGPQLQEFLGTIIQQVGLTVQPGNPILSTWISTDGHFAFCEMRSIEECNMALMLNQLPLLGQPLKFGRPKSFMGPPQPMPVLPPRTQTALTNLGCTPNTAWFATPTTDVSSVAAMTASLTAASLPIPIAAPFVSPTPVAPIAALPAETSSNKLIMSNIPVVLTEDQVKELVEPFGELKSLELLKDPSTHQSTGSALFEYVEEKVTDSAKDGLDGLDLGGIPLAVRRATASEETGPVLRMANMVSLDELKDDEEFADLKEDVEEECKRFGNVVALEIPRPKDGEAVAGLGDIFVQFESANEAAAALKALSGRKFGGNIVKVSYFPLAKLQQKDFA